MFCHQKRKNHDQNHSHSKEIKMPNLRADKLRKVLENVRWMLVELKRGESIEHVRKYINDRAVEDDDTMERESLDELT